MVGRQLALALCLGAALAHTRTANALPLPPPGGYQQSSPIPRPFPPLARPVFLPALGAAGGADMCDGWIHVQSVGDEPSQAAVLTWGEVGEGDPCPGPIAMACSGLLGPGAVWRFPIRRAGEAAASAVVFSFNVRTFVDAAVPPPQGASDDTPLADWLCGVLSDSAPMRCEGYRAFRRAYDQGAGFADVPLRLAYGAPLAVHVERACRSGAEKLERHVSGYNGLTATGGVEELLTVQSYHASPVFVSANGLGTAVHIQNRGVKDASVEALFNPADRCVVLRPCRLPFTVAPGASFELDLAGCAEPGAAGNLVVIATEPLAVLVDLIGADRLLSYAAAPAEVRASANGPPLFTPGSPIAFGPLVNDPRALHAPFVHVHNLDSARPARARVTVLDPWGSPQGLPRDTVICPGGGVQVSVPAPADSTNTPGSVRVESLVDPGPGAEPPPNISAVVILDDPPASAYPLLPEDQSFRWPAGDGRCGANSGAALLALPAVDAAVDRLIVANAVPNPGVTQVAVLLFDQNGRIGGVCRPLAAQQVLDLDLAGHGLAGTGWRGGALVSAAWWSHAVIDGRRIRNVVGLAALTVHRPAAADLGDALSTAVGIPQRPNRDLHVGALADTSPLSLGCPWPPPRHDMAAECDRRLDGVYLPWTARR